MSLIGSRKSGISASWVAAAETAVVVSMAPQDTGEGLDERCAGGAASVRCGNSVAGHGEIAAADPGCGRPRRVLFRGRGDGVGATGGGNRACHVDLGAAHLQQR